MPFYKLGDKITFNSTLYRERENGGRMWVDEPHSSREGIVVGIRTLHNGYMDYDYSDYTGKVTASWFVHQSSLRAYLVVENLYQKPILTRAIP